MLRNDKQELMQEMQKIKEKNKSLEKERANLQTQLNKFRQSVRHLLKSDSSVQSDAPSSYNYVSYHSSSRPSQNSSYGRTNDRLHASAHSAFYNVKVPPKLAISQ
jgi:chromosome segregation ATPase